MGIITAIEPQKKNKSRVSVFIDGEFACGLSVFTAKKFRLEIGKELSEDFFDSVITDSEAEACFDTACKLLGSHRKTVKEMREYLSKKEFDGRAVDSAMRKLIEYRFLDDFSYAKDYIATYRGKYGARKLGYELKNKGIDEETISEALQNIADQRREATALAEKYVRIHPKADRRKIFTYLFSKGFDSDDVNSAINSVNLKKEIDNEDYDSQRD